MKNHLFLVMGYIDELKEMAIAQRLIDVGREEHATDQEVQLGLDRIQADINAKRDEIYDAMFEIPRSN